MRFINILLVLLFVGVLAAGAYLLGNRVNSDANDALTSTLPEGPRLRPRKPDSSRRCSPRTPISWTTRRTRE